MADAELTTPAEPATRGERRRRELIEATLRVIADQGIRAVTHRSVAAEAGLPLAATTYYFASKEDLISACLRHAATAEIAELERRVEAVDPAALSPEEWADGLIDWLEEELGEAARPRLVARYQLQLEAAHQPELGALYESWTVAAFRFAETLLSAAGSPQPAVDAAIVLAAVDGMRFNALSRSGQTSVGLLRPVLVRLMDRLLA